MTLGHDRADIPFLHPLERSLSIVAKHRAKRETLEPKWPSLDTFLPKVEEPETIRRVFPLHRSFIPRSGISAEMIETPWRAPPPTAL